MYTVYKHLDNEENIIYIGKSKSLLHRQRQHSKNAEWFDEIDSIEYCVLDSKIEMDIVELYLINTLNPKYNKKDNRNDEFNNINIIELKWLKFDLYEIKIKNKLKNSNCTIYKNCCYFHTLSDINTLVKADKRKPILNNMIKSKDGMEYDIQNIVMYSVDDDLNAKYNMYDVIYITPIFGNMEKEVILKNITKLKLISYYGKEHELRISLE